MKFLTFRPQRFEAAPPNGVLVSEWRVGRRRVRLAQDVHIVTGSVGILRCEWEPDRPRKLNKAEWRQYRAGRDAHSQRVANIIGGAVACAEL
jgi:hypothetical protein